MSIMLITLTIRIDKNFFFEGRSIRRDNIVCQTEFDGQMGNAEPELGVIITHWKDACLLKFPDAALQEEADAAILTSFNKFFAINI
jgi:hypothetical protein